MMLGNFMNREFLEYVTSDPCVLEFPTVVVYLIIMFAIMVKYSISQLINQAFNVMFRARTGQTLTRTSQRYDSWSAAIDGSKFNTDHQHTANKCQTVKKNLSPDALPIFSYKNCVHT